MNYFAFWYLVGAAAIRFTGFETKGRTIAEIDGTPTASGEADLASEAATRQPAMGRLRSTRASRNHYLPAPLTKRLTGARLGGANAGHRHDVGS